MHLSTFILMGKVILIILCDQENVLSLYVEDYTGTCNNDKCVADANRLSTLMNTSANPCENFYNYVCGNVAGNTLETIELLRLVKQSVQRKISLAVSAKIDYNPGAELPILRKAKILFRTCLNFDSSITPVRNTIEDLEGWPVLTTNWNSSDSYYSWEKYFRNFAIQGLHANDFFTISFRTIPKPDYLFFIQATKIPLTDDVKNLIIQRGTPLQVTNLLHNAIKLFGVNNFNEINDAVNEYVQFTRKIMCAYNMIDFPVIIYNNLHDLEKDFPDIPWLKVFQGFIHPIPIINRNTVWIGTDEFMYSDQIKVRVDCRKCLKTISHLVNNTPVRTLVNYVMLRLVIKAIPFLSESLRKDLRRIEESITLSQQPPQPQDMKIYCENLISTSCMPRIVDFAYISEYKLFDYAKDTRLLTNRIKRQLLELLSKNQWLDTSSKIKITNKISNLVLQIAFPDILYNKTYMDIYYQQIKDIDFSDSNQYWNVSLIFNRLEKYQKLRDFLRHADPRNEWSLSPTSTSSLTYIRDKNIVVIPVTSLEGTIFHHDRPSYLNYAAAGFVIGHQMMRSILGGNLYYDGFGDPLLDSLLSPKSRTAYERGVECFREQFRGLIQHNPSINTMVEILADYHGISLARQSYEVFRNEMLREEALSDDLSQISTRQLFWIQYASLWCSNSVRAIPLPPTRIYLSLANSVQFSKDWSCTHGSLMNHINKCSLYF